MLGARARAARVGVDGEEELSALHGTITTQVG